MKKSTPLPRGINKVHDGGTLLAGTIDTLAKRGECRRIGTRQLIMGPDSPPKISLLLSGSVGVLYLDKQGRDLILGYLDPGDLVGVGALSRVNPLRDIHLVSKAPCELLQVEVGDFRRLMQTNPNLLQLVINQFARQFIRVAELHFEHNHLDVLERVRQALKYLCSLDATLSHPEGYQIKMTRLEISRLVGCSREAVGRALKKLAANNEVKTRGHKIIFRTHEDLKRDHSLSLRMLF